MLIQLQKSKTIYMLCQCGHYDIYFNKSRCCYETYINDLKASKNELNDFDEGLFYALVDRVKVNNDGIVIVWKDGTESKWGGRFFELAFLLYIRSKLCIMYEKIRKNEKVCIDVQNVL